MNNSKGYLFKDVQAAISDISEPLRPTVSTGCAVKGLQLGGQERQQHGPRVQPKGLWGSSQTPILLMERVVSKANQ